ncbi:type II toxin-antitoxin system prevent-host-death family antitoxin [Mycobacterium sp. KBS0706]|uniref:type II toxin-antitoxin system prevent-host-death family antitoxin n=1 Tax=Mycobacterium sp. KBS0706 TaxID=2578109 RepID=UPI00110FDB42|nr:type II toxin-antitoxin system prevent-host-death family antitoxin [Mycobacterium sp. KBS0706]TSD89494.1 type II toxin-antitoxin system prevent-host-death family antitoxin [Mycobacterium sp. KBS0706]
MSSYSTSDLSRRSGDVIAEALRHPVTITQRNKPRLVLMAIEDFERLSHRAEDPRNAYVSGEEPAEVRAELLAALDDIVNGKLARASAAVDRRD